MFPCTVWSIDRQGAYVEQQKDRFYWLVTIHSASGITERLRVFTESAATRIVSELATMVGMEDHTVCTDDQGGGECLGGEVVDPPAQSKCAHDRHQESGSRDDDFRW